MRPDVIITIFYGIGVMVAMILMGTEVIHNPQVVDKLLLTIPATSALVIGYWFAKNRGSE